MEVMELRNTTKMGKSVGRLSSGVDEGELNLRAEQ